MSFNPIPVGASNRNLMFFDNWIHSVNATYWTRSLYLRNQAVIILFKLMPHMRLVIAILVLC